MEINNDARNIAATELELRAAINHYEAACIRGDDKAASKHADACAALLDALLMHKRRAIVDLLSRSGKR